MINIASPSFQLRVAAVAACLLSPSFAAAAPPVAGPNVNMVSGTRFPEGDPFLTKQNEPSIAVSSRHPRHLLAASNDYRQVAVLTAEGLKGGKAWNTLYKSVDGGTSWRSVVLGGCPLDIPACNDATGLTAPLKALAPDFSADPTVRSGPHGTFFYSFIAGRRDGSTDGVVAVQRFVDKNNNIQRDTDVRRIAGQDVVKWAEDPILPDKLNILDRGTSGQFIDKPWNAADVGGRSWNAGKTCELLSWTRSSTIVTPAAETVPAFNVYVSYAIFAGGGNNEHPSVYVAASQDCGNTFAKPVKVSNSLDATSGTSMAINPLTGTVYVAWRRFGSLESPAKPDEIYVNKSTDGGRTWLNQPVRVAQFIPYDQGATGSSFRTLAFPSVAVSVDGTGKSRVHVAFTARGAAVNPLPPYDCQSTANPANPADCDARIRIATSVDGGLTWSAPSNVDPIPSVPTNPAGRGHQVQPALTFAAGKLFVTWLDQRFDQTEEVLECPAVGTCTAANLVPRRVAMGNLDPNCSIDVGAAPLSALPQAYKDLLGPDPGACYEYRPGRPASVWTTYLTDGTPGLVRRHTIDLFAAMADPADAPVFAGNSNRISQYLFGSTARDAEGRYQIRQKELFAPNLPLFVNGGAAFVGDYIDSAGQNIVATNESDPSMPGKYRYKFNVGSSTSPFTTGGLSPVFHVAHTDNRNVIPPISGNWATPTCLATAFTGDPSNPTTDFGGCSTPGYAGNRNQDVFSTIVTEGSAAYANANSKALGASARAFVVTVDNFGRDPAGRRYQLSIVAPPGTASFDRNSFAATLPKPFLTSTEVQVQPRSSATRSVWVTGSSTTSIVVNVTSPVGCSGASCEYATQVALNPDPGAVDSLVGTGDGPGIADTANNDLGNVVLSNAVLTNNVLSNNALTNAALSNNALTNAALSNVVLSNAVLSNLQVENLSPGNAALTNNVLTNNVLTNVVLTNAALDQVAVALTNNVLTNNVLSNATPEAVALSNAVLSNNALTNVALTNIDPANVALSNAALTNNVLSNVALSNNALTNVMLSNAALTNAALTNVVLSNAALSNNALSNNALSNNVLSNNALSNSPLSDDLRTVEAANLDLGKNDFTADDLGVSDFLDASFTVRNRGNTDTTLAIKLLLRDTGAGGCAGGSCSLPDDVKLQLVMRKIALTPTAIPPTGPAVDTGRAYRLGLVQSNAQVSNVGTPEIVDPDAPDLGKFLPGKADAATLPLAPGERAYVTLRAVGKTGDFNLVEFLRWGAKVVAVDAANDTRTLVPLVIRTLTLDPVTASASAVGIPLRTRGGFGTITGSVACADSTGAPVAAPCLPPAAVAPFAAADGIGSISITPSASGTYYLLVTVQDDGSIPPQDDRQLLKLVVNAASQNFVGFPPSGADALPTALQYGQTLQLPTLVSTSGLPAYYTTTGPCSVDNNVLQTTGVSPPDCVLFANQDGNAIYASIKIDAPPITISQATSATTVSSSANPSTYGSSVTFTATVTGGNPGGTVAFKDGATSISGCAAQAVTGTGNARSATCSTGALAAGAHGIVASYSGDANNTPSSSGALLQQVNAATTTAITSSLNPSTYGDLVVLTATVATDPPGGGTPAGTVTLSDSGNMPAFSGAAPTIGTSTSTLLPGTHRLTAVFAPAAGGDYQASTGTLDQVVNRTPTSIGLAAAPNPAVFGTTVNLTATVSPAAATGTVTFSDGATTLGQGVLTAGSASFAATALMVGTHGISATYGGDDFHAPATVTPPISVVINPPFAATGPMVQPRSYHTSTRLNDGRVLLAGGFDATGAPTATSEIYCAVAVGNCAAGDVGKFKAVGNLPSKSAAHTASLLSNGKVLVAGGGNSSAEIFDPATNTWTAAGGMSSTRSYHTATPLTDGNGNVVRVLLTGGADNSGKTLQSTILFDPATGSFTNGPTLLFARERHTATPLYDATGRKVIKVLIAGGRQKSGSGYVVQNSAEFYDPASNTVASAGSMAARRFAHAAAALADGSVVVAGGSNDTSGAVTTSLAGAELYAAGSWLATPAPLQQARREFTMTRLADGRLLAVGGISPTLIAECSQAPAGGTSPILRIACSEIYSPGTGGFSLGGSMVSAARSGHAATLLADGRVLVTGGTAAGGLPVNSAELFTGPPPGP